MNVVSIVAALLCFALGTTLVYLFDLTPMKWLYRDYGDIAVLVGVMLGAFGGMLLVGGIAQLIAQMRGL